MTKGKKNTTETVEEVSPIPESTTTTETVEEVTSKKQTLELKEGEVAIKLKNGKGGLVKIFKADFPKYEDKFEIVEEGKKK